MHKVPLFLQWEMGGGKEGVGRMVGEGERWRGRRELEQWREGGWEVGVLGSISHPNHPAPTSNLFSPVLMVACRMCTVGWCCKSQKEMQCTFFAVGLLFLLHSHLILLLAALLLLGLH
jgi:hypothetical protein